MRHCMSCGAGYVSSDWKCPKCAWVPSFQYGVPILASEISGANESYDPSWYPKLVKLEASNFWFKSRNQLIGWLISRYLPEKARYMEIGCGSGFVLQMIRNTFPSWDISATEAQIEGLKFAMGRVSSDVSFLQMDARAIPFREEFDAIGAFDVIEHIKEDSDVLLEINRALKMNGYVILSVPQHMFLWSQYDDVGCHFRRYSKNELFSKLENAGFKIIDSTSFTSLLLPAMLLSRLTKKSKNANVDVMQEFQISAFLNSLLSFVMNIEFLLVKLGIRWPVGGSRIVIAQKADKRV